MKYRVYWALLLLFAVVGLVELGKCTAAFIEVDRCLDAGGAWDEKTKSCRF